MLLAPRPATGRSVFFALKPRITVSLDLRRRDKDAGRDAIERNPQPVTVRINRYRLGQNQLQVNRPLFAGDPEVRILGFGKEHMWKQIFT